MRDRTEEELQQDKEKYGQVQYSNHDRTPVPWVMEDGMIFTKDGIPVAMMHRQPGNGTQPYERDANCRFIKQACNSFEILVDAIEAILDFLEEEDEPTISNLRSALEYAYEQGKFHEADPPQQTVCYLRSCDPELHDEVLAAAEDTLEDWEDLEAAFEHGQWWIIDKPSGKSWSVHDNATPSDDETTFGFEEVSEGDNEQ